MRVGVLGLTNPNIPHWDPPSHWRGLDLRRPGRGGTGAPRRGCAQRADVVIVVVHSGFERDLGHRCPRRQRERELRLAAGAARRDRPAAHRPHPPGHPAARARRNRGRAAGAMGRARHARGPGAGNGEGGVAGDVGWRRGEPEDRGRGRRTRRSWRRWPRRGAGGGGAGATARRADGAAAGERACRSPTTRALDLIHAVQLEATGAQLSLAAPLGGGRRRVPRRGRDAAPGARPLPVPQHPGRRAPHRRASSGTCWSTPCAAGSGVECGGERDHAAARPRRCRPTTTTPWRARPTSSTRPHRSGRACAACGSPARLVQAGRHLHGGDQLLPCRRGRRLPAPRRPRRGSRRSTARWWT